MAGGKITEGQHDFPGKEIVTIVEDHAMVAVEQG
jgi:hypothetical protein